MSNDAPFSIGIFSNRNRDGIAVYLDLAMRTFHVGTCLGLTIQDNRPAAPTLAKAK